MMKKLIILGCTGSIGRNAIDVASAHPSDFKVVALASRSSREECELFASRFGARAYCGEDSAVRAVEENDADICLIATVGLSGLKPALLAIEKGMDIALATKEVLVMAGEMVMRKARERGVRILPVDSEHSAIFQCIQGSKANEIEKLILTASGGPFLDGPEDLSSVTLEETLNHPRWKMGPKVTVDSATMMNKGFEMIEAKWLFDVSYDAIEVVVHPEAIVHSLVTFSDGATLAQLSPPDMRVAIQYALTWPRRLSAERANLSLPSLKSLTFREADPIRFPSLRLVREALAEGGGAPAQLAAADELAVSAFLEGRLRYIDIASAVEEVLMTARRTHCLSLESVMETVAETQSAFSKVIEKFSRR
jgi:1-deoxy-D-xylulose-5-phosphate reductoisomerase